MPRRPAPRTPTCRCRARSSRTRALPTTASPPAAAPRTSTSPRRSGSARRRGAATGNDAERRGAEAAGRRGGPDRPRLAGAPRVRADARAAHLSGRPRLRGRHGRHRPRRPRRDPRKRCWRRAATAKVTGAGFHSAQRLRDRRRRRPTATGDISDRREAGLSVTARSADGTGSGYFAGDHFDLARLDAKHIVEQAVGKAVRSQQPKPIEPGVYPVDPRAAGGRRPDRIPDRQPSTRAPRTKGAARSRRRTARRASARRCSTSGSICTATRCTRICRRRRAPPKAFRRRGCRSIKAGVLENLEYSRFWAQEKQARADARAGQLHHGELAAAGVARRHDQGHGARPADLALLVRAADRPAHARCSPD